MQRPCRGHGVRSCNHANPSLQDLTPMTLLSRIPGIGSVTVAKVLAYAGDVSRFGSAKALSAFAGVCPQQ